MSRPWSVNCVLGPILISGLCLWGIRRPHGPAAARRPHARTREAAATGRHHAHGHVISRQAKKPHLADYGHCRRCKGRKLAPPTSLAQTSEALNLNRPPTMCVCPLPTHLPTPTVLCPHAPRRMLEILAQPHARLPPVPPKADVRRRARLQRIQNDGPARPDLFNLPLEMP